MKVDAQTIYQAASWTEAVAQAQTFAPVANTYPALVTRLRRDLPEFLAFFQGPWTLWRKLRTTNVIERCFVEVRQRTRPVVCFVNAQSEERIIFFIFNRFNLDGYARPSSIYTSRVTLPMPASFLTTLCSLIRLLKANPPKRDQYEDITHARQSDHPVL